VLEARGSRVRLLDTAPSGGDQPVSITVRGGLLYVLNAGGSGNIAGFTVDRRGNLDALGGSTRPLSSGASAPAQVEFAPDGDTIVVTEKATDVISIYRIGRDGRASGPAAHSSHGATPFGFGFDRRGHLIVSEAFGGAPDASAVSSYKLSSSGEPTVVSGSVPTTETAACWIVVTKNGRFTYTTNTGSGSITGYAVGRDGRLAVLDADGRTGVTGPGTAPTDMALSGNSRFLYALNSGTGEVVAFEVRPDGGLTHIGDAGSLLPSAVGMAAR
jgi:6-phosphogluconolactonase (cycloisomerase 2 family)